MLICYPLIPTRSRKLNTVSYVTSLLGVSRKFIRMSWKTHMLQISVTYALLELGSPNSLCVMFVAVSSKVDYPGFCDMDSTPSAQQLCTSPLWETQVSLQRETEDMQRTEGRYSEPQTWSLTQWVSIHCLSKQINKFQLYRVQISALRTLTHLPKKRSPLPIWHPTDCILGVWATGTGKSKLHEMKVRLGSIL